MRPQRENPDEKARDWLVQLNAAEPDERLQARFAAWLSASQENAMAFERAERLWEDIGLTDLACAEAEALMQPTPVAPSPYPRRAMLVGAAAAMLAVAVWFSGWLTVSSPEAIEYAARLGETRTFRLTDGSQVTLESNALMVARIGTRARAIELRRGRAQFAVTHDAARVFSVHAGQARIDVLGTDFTVRRDAETTRVAVLAGRVSVSSASSAPHVQRTLQAGQAVHTDREGLLSEITSINPKAELAWLDGRLVYDNALLRDIVFDLNNHRRSQIRIMDASLNTLRITTSFRIEQADQFLEGLVVTQPVHLQQQGSDILLFEAP